MATSDVPPPPPSPSGPARSASVARQGGGPGWLLPVALAVALGAAAVTGTVAFRQHQQVGRLRAELVEAEARIAELEAEQSTAGGGLGELFGDLFGGDGGLEGLFEGGLDALLDGLFGGGDDLEDLRGGADLSRCLAGDGLEGPFGNGDPIVAGTLAEQIDATADRVETLRGLAFSEPVEPELLSPAEFVARVTELVSEDYTAADADRDRRVLAALGAVERGAELRALVLDLVGEQAAGFYDSDTGQLVVRAADADAPLGPAGQVILAHELQHAAADQEFGLPADRADTPERDDSARAGLALAEGDATLFMQQFALGALDPMDQLAMATDPSLTEGQERLRTYPEFLQRELLFPYTEGTAFACALHADGGWPAVDAAYEALPTTTAQILWPERYTAGEDAVSVAGRGAPGGSWSAEHTTTFGAAELLWLFSAPGDDAEAALDEPRERAAGWAGGRLELWTDGGHSAVAIALAQRPEERDLCASMSEWYGAAFPDARSARVIGEETLAVTGPDQAAVVICDESTVRLGIAPDLATARRVGG